MSAQVRASSAAVDEGGLGTRFFIRQAPLASPADRRVDTSLLNTPRGTIRVSTPEATAFDLVGYPAHVGGFDRGGDVIARDFITEWRAHAPWVADVQVEQYLVICRALVKLFSRPLVARAFRSGTALYKLHLRPGGPLLGGHRPRTDRRRADRPRARGGARCARHVARSGALEAVGRPSHLDVSLRIGGRAARADEAQGRDQLARALHRLGHRHVRFEVASRWFAGGADVCTYSPLLLRCQVGPAAAARGRSRTRVGSSAPGTRPHLDEVVVRVDALEDGEVLQHRLPRLRLDDVERPAVAPPTK